MIQEMQKDQMPEEGQISFSPYLESRTDKVHDKQFWLLLGALCILGVQALPVIPLVCTWLGFQRCASWRTRPEGGGRWRHYLCYTWGVCWAAQKTACQKYGWNSDFHGFKLYMLALEGRPSLRSYDACMVYSVQGASRRNCRQKQGETSFSPKKVFLWCLILGLLLRSLMLVVGLLMVILLWMLDFISWRLLSID